MTHTDPSSAAIHDLSDLRILDETTIVECIRDRFYRDIIYTYIGDVLIAVNPFKPLPLYNEKHHVLYKENTNRKQNPPHVFWVSGNAFRSLVESRKARCIIVGGISGAGKTECTKHIFEHILHQGGHQHPNLVENLKGINPLLELFGNSVTRLNDNSSRFGKLIGLRYDEHGKLDEANISCYMLEKSRVINQSDGERNFHIFYAFTQGISDDRLKSFDLHRRNLYDSRIVRGHRKKAGDDTALDNARRIMQKVGFTDQHIDDMYRILAAILIMANVKFKEEDSTGLTVLREDSERDTVPLVCGLLHIEESELIPALISSSSYTQKGELITSSKTTQKAKDGRDAFAKYLYSCLFDALVKQINMFLKHMSGSHRRYSNRDSQFTYELSILDIAGFENFTNPMDTNSYEQLLINITNEHMHQFFLKKVLKAELEAYEREGVQCADLPDTDNTDNRDAIDLLTKTKLCVIGILEDSTAQPNVSDGEFVRQLNRFHGKNRNFRLNDRDPYAFRIRHFAGEVEYDANGFIDKNRDTMTEDLKRCLQKSDNFFLPRASTIHESISKMTIERLKLGEKKGSRGRLQGFVSKEYQKSLHSLVNKLEKTEPLFVRCIKSNIGQEPDCFDETFVKKQLLRSGVLEISRVRKQGFSVRMLFEEFLKKFSRICENGSRHLPQKERVIEVLKEAKIDQYTTGDRLVFLKFSGLDTLEKLMMEIERKQKEAEERQREKELEIKRQRELEMDKSRPVEEIQHLKEKSPYYTLSAGNTESSGEATATLRSSSGTESLSKGEKESIKSEDEKEHELLAYDAFRQVDQNDEDEKIIERYVLPACRISMFICLFVIIVGTGTVIKLLFRNLIDTYTRDEEHTMNTVNLLLCIGVPPGMTLLASMGKVLFGSMKPLKKRFLVVVVWIGIFHMLGVGVLIFNILPHFDAFRGNIILLNVAIVPSFLSFLMKFKCSNCVPRRRIVSLIITCIALCSQLGGAFVCDMYIITKDNINTDDTGILKLRIMYPITVLLISLEWWENFISGNMKIFCHSFHLDHVRRHLEKTRIKASVVIIMAKLVTIVCFAFFLARHDIMDVKRVSRFQPAVSFNTTASPLQNTTVLATSKPLYDIGGATLVSVPNNVTNGTDDVRTFVHGNQSLSCVTTEETNTTLILGCTVLNGTNILLDIICINGSTLCSQLLNISDNTTSPFDDHYYILVETKSSVTFTNTSNNITCSKHAEPDDMIRLHCKSYGIALELLCKEGYTKCKRILPEEENTFLRQLETLWEDNYIVICTLLLSSVFSYASLLACKLHMQQFSFSLSIILISPITSGVIYLNCRNIFTFKGIIPDVASCAPMDFASIQMSIILGAGLWLGIVLLTYYIWIPRYERMAKVERLFVEPLKECFFSDINMLLRRKNDRTHRYMRIPVRSNSMPDIKGVPQIKICATMWHETITEMQQLLKSLFRLDIHHAASVSAQSKSNHIDPDSFTPEIHIIFDDAFDTVTKNGRKMRQPNEYVMQFLESNDKAARDVAQCDASEWECIPQKKQTPFGAQLIFKMPGGTKMNVHLKDKSKIRHRKRWSQIMYLYYLLGFKTFGMKKLGDILKKPANAGASLFSFLKPEYQEQMKNTFILTLDGDVDFNPDAVILLLDRMKKNPKTGAVCGRIHPIGGGPMVWYQQFEYAIGHWLQKAAEHILGCVLCCPGCFSLFRASALMDDNVMNTYTTKPTEARHYIQFEQGEDRWLCTLLLQRGHKIDYEAGADALTYAPETFNEFFVQRRRWAPSTMANIMDLLGSWKNTCRINDNISTMYIVYQFVVLMSSLLAPATVTLMIAGSYATVLNINPTYSFYLSITPIIIFVIVCLKCKNDTQLNLAALLSAFYTLIMVIVTVGTMLNLANDDFLSPNVLFLVGLGIIFTLAGIWHPKEFGCLVHGLLYYFTVPSTFIFLTVYFFCNLNNVSWGTREGPKVPAEGTPTAGTAAPPPTQEKGFVAKLLDLVKGSCCEDLIESMSKEVQERFNKDKAPKAAAAIPTPQVVRTDKPPKDEYIDTCLWMHSKEFEKGEFLTCSDDEVKFWEEILKKYLYPLDNDNKHEEQMKDDLASLRNNVVFAFFMLNFMFGVALLQLQLNREKIISFYILGKYEPVSVSFLAIFTLILTVQFIAMILHRWGTFLHLISNCKLNIFLTSKMSEEEKFREYLKECVGLMNGKSPTLNSKGPESDSDKDYTTTNEDVELPADYDLEDESSSSSSSEEEEGSEKSKDPDSESQRDNIRGTFYNQRFKKNYHEAMRTVRRRKSIMMTRKKSTIGRVRISEDPRLEFYERRHGHSHSGRRHSRAHGLLGQGQGYGQSQGGQSYGQSQGSEYAQSQGQRYGQGQGYGNNLGRGQGYGNNQSHGHSRGHHGHGHEHSQGHQGQGYGHGNRNHYPTIREYPGEASYNRK